MSSPTRPVMRYYGGKWKLAPWIISVFPAHRVYTETFGGAGSVLLRKPRAYAEIYNDMDGEIVNVFRVLRDHDKAAELAFRIAMTPFARDEFDLSYETSDDEIEQARRTIFRTYAGFGSSAMNSIKPTGFRSNSNRPGTTPAHDWANFPDVLPAIIDRLSGVVIENRPAIEIIRQHDGNDTLHYVDPPYIHSTRKARQQSNYRYEMTDDQHCELASVLHSCAGMVVLSGYNCELYQELYSDWRRIDKKTYADGARERTESLWINPSADKQKMNLWI